MAVAAVAGAVPLTVHSFHALDESFSAVPKTVESVVPDESRQRIQTEVDRAVVFALNCAVAENFVLGVTVKAVADEVVAVISPAAVAVRANEATPLKY